MAPGRMAEVRKPRIGLILATIEAYMRALTPFPQLSLPRQNSLMPSLIDLP
jgi:hypothetical protein